MSSADPPPNRTLLGIGYALIGPLSTVIGVSESLVLTGLLNIASSLAMIAIPSVRALGPGPEVVTGLEIA